MNGLMITGEASGDLYGGRLAASLKRRIPSLVLAGMGGDEMIRAGVDIIYHCGHVSVVGIFEVFSKLRHLNRAYSRVKDWVLQNKPEFAVLIDFPDFNFRVARFLKKHRIKTFYFISPQVWAWRRKRVNFLRDHVDLMIVILPFEKEIYERAGVPVVYAGHPLVEMVREEVVRQPVYVRTEKPLIGIMPGSRDVEVRRHLTILQEALSLVRKKIDVEGVLLWPPWLALEKYPVTAGMRVQKDQRYSAMKACDLLLVTSGTSTLECAILGASLFIVYRVSPVSWQLGKLLVRVPYYGLVNWIAQEKCIPEYIQQEMNAGLLASDAVTFLKDESRRSKMKSDLARIVESLGPGGAIERAVDAILERL